MIVTNSSSPQSEPADYSARFVILQVPLLPATLMGIRPFRVDAVHERLRRLANVNRSCRGHHYVC